MSDSRPSLLILSFSDISNDARVKKQVKLFADRYRVTTCGFGDPVRADIEHLSLSQHEGVWAARFEAVLLRVRAYRTAYWRQPYVRGARALLQGKAFDSVIANDLETVGLAVREFGRERVHADLHEYYPGLHDQVAAWNRIRKPFLEWQLRTFLPMVASVTTVSDTIAERYRGEYGFECSVVRNATPRQNLPVNEVGQPIRIVHAGGAQPNRRIEVMMQAVANSKEGATLDLYLTQEKSEYAEKLRRLSMSLGDRITIHPPMPQEDLLSELNRYDVGIHILPHTNTNNALALPNKFFDFVQARLGIIIGPTEDMVRLLDGFQIGSVTSGFEVSEVTAAVDELSVMRVETWKKNADKAAEVLNSEREESGWEAALLRIAI